MNDTELVKHQIEITQYQAAGPVAEQVVDIKDATLKDIINPYPDQTPTELLQRTYKVAEFSWGPITSTNIVDFPASLTVIPQIADKLKQYKYMRSAVRVQIKLLTTQYHYGAYMVSWIPNHNTTDYAGSIRQQSANRPIVISAADQGTAVFDIPYINPYTFWPTNDNKNQICRLFLTPITPLLRASSSVTDTVKVQVYASFVEPIVTGYIGQSAIEEAAKPFDWAEHGDDELPQPPRRKKKWKRKPKEPQAPVKNPRTMQYEAFKKTAAGVVDTGTKATTSVSTFLEKLPMIGGMVEDAVLPFLKALAILDKPSSIASSEKCILSFTNDLSLGSGLDNSNPLSLHPMTPLSMELDVAGENIMSGSMTIARVIRTPMIRDVVTLTNANPTWNNRVIPRDPDYKDDFVAYMSRYFRFWRGSFKYMICFYTSTFITARVRISVRYNTNPITDLNDGDIVSRLVDVKGDTIVELTVPYLWDTLYRPTEPVTFLPLITVSLTSPIVGLSIDTDPSIATVIWRSAGEDFVFSQLVSYTQDVTEVDSLDFESSSEIETAEPQMNPQERFRMTFDGIVQGTNFTFEDGLITGEKIVSLNDMLKRYTDNNVNRPNNTYPDTLGVGAFHRLSEIFKYWRGSRRTKTRYKIDGSDYSEQTIIAENPSGSTDAGNGLVLTVPTQWNWNEVQVPWYSSLPFIPTNQATVYHYEPLDNPTGVIYYPSLEAAANGRNLISGGDDFVYIYLVSPP